MAKVDITSVPTWWADLRSRLKWALDLVEAGVVFVVKVPEGVDRKKLKHLILSRLNYYVNKHGKSFSLATEDHADEIWFYRPDLVQKQFEEMGCIRAERRAPSGADMRALVVDYSKVKRD